MSLLSALALPPAVAALAVLVGAPAYARKVIGTPGSPDDFGFGAPCTCCSDGVYPSKGEATIGRGKQVDLRRREHAFLFLQPPTRT